MLSAAGTAVVDCAPRGAARMSRTAACAATRHVRIHRTSEAIVHRCPETQAAVAVACKVRIPLLPVHVERHSHSSRHPIAHAAAPESHHVDTIGGGHGKRDPPAIRQLMK